MQKRSGHVALALLGAAAFGLSGCGEEETDARAFPDKQSCLTAVEEGGWFSAADCETAFAEAEALHRETAPRYESRELCEQEHGAGACGADTVAGNPQGGGSIFMPLIAGYLIGSALGNARAVSSQPLVKTPGGGFATPDGGTRLSNNSGSGKIGTSAFSKAPTTLGKAPMTKAQVAQRGGFGKTGGLRSSGG
ncbi:MAG: DUF1190 domain-containing protein [Paracoccaceae bacterium]